MIIFLVLLFIVVFVIWFIFREKQSINKHKKNINYKNK